MPNETFQLLPNDVWLTLVLNNSASKNDTDDYIDNLFYSYIAPSIDYIMQEVQCKGTIYQRYEYALQLIARILKDNGVL